MPTSESTILINDLLISIHRSLLQYAAEAWPWSGAAAPGLRTGILEAARRQEESVQKLVRLLTWRGHPVQFGTYPLSFTSLHFVSAEYLLERIIQGQARLVEKCRRVADALADDQELAPVAESLVATESQILQSLQSLQAVASR